MYINGCTGEDQDLADLLYERAFYRNSTYNPDSMQYRIWNQKLMRRLDSVYLYEKNRLDDLSFTNQHIFENIHSDERDYEQIKKIALEEKNLYALIALTKYNKVADRDMTVSLLLNRLEYEKIFTQMEDIIKAVLSYADENSKEKMETIWKNKRSKWKDDYSYGNFRKLAQKYNLRID